MFAPQSIRNMSNDDNPSRIKDGGDQSEEYRSRLLTLAQAYRLVVPVASDAYRARYFARKYGPSQNNAQPTQGEDSQPKVRDSQDNAQASKSEDRQSRVDKLAEGIRNMEPTVNHTDPDGRSRSSE